MATVEVDAFIAGLQSWAARSHAATEAGAEEAGAQLQGRIKDALARSEYPPSSDPGTPPARRSGTLQDSVQNRLVEIGTGFQARVYPSTVYARIHELSGWTGAGHRTFLPKRPYVGPTLDAFTPSFRTIAYDAWRDALPGR